MKKAEPDRNTVARIGQLIQATRKHLGMNQTALAPQLGLDQSALSRVESGKQMLTAAQWFMFAGITGISPDAPTYGVIELNQPESAMRLPRRYAFEKHTKVRALLPMLQYARGSLGERGLNSFLSEVKVEPEFFVNLNASINFNFTIDLAETLVKKTKMSIREAELVTRTAGDPTVHGSLHNFYDYIYSDQLALLSALVSRCDDYDSNFKHQVVDESRGQIDVAVTPASHMSEFDYRNRPVLGDFFAHYEKGYFENFSTYGGQKAMKVTILESIYKGDSRCLYRMKAAR
jgi:transcriptional regulator with XRE-family HTH domain